MPRFGSSCFILAGCQLAVALCGSTVFGRDDYRATVFRELTSDQPAPPRARAAEPVKADPANENGPAATPAGPTIVAPRTISNAPSTPASFAVGLVVPRTSVQGGNSPGYVMSQFPRRAAVRSNPRRTTRRHAKPFETAEQEPTISPYLNLDRDENDPQDTPTYLTMVLPQLEQMQMNRTHQREIQQLRGQLQNMSANVGAAPQFETNNTTRMRQAARFMDTAQFYGGSR